MKDIEDTNIDVEDSLDNLLTLEDFCRVEAQSVIDRIKSNPIEIANSMRMYHVINDKEYKEMIINIRKIELEEDFK